MTAIIYQFPVNYQSQDDEDSYWDEVYRQHYEENEQRLE